MDRHSPVVTSHIDARIPLSSQETRLPSPRSDSTPRSDMMTTLQSHNALLHSAIKVRNTQLNTYGYLQHFNVYLSFVYSLFYQRETISQVFYLTLRTDVIYFFKNTKSKT